MLPLRQLIGGHLRRHGRHFSSRYLCGTRVRSESDVFVVKDAPHFVRRHERVPVLTGRNDQTSIRRSRNY